MAADAEPDLPRGVALAWGVAADPQRGPKREMSVEKIVETAVDVADAEGLGAVSMAAVAARMGFTPMSLYRYVSAKDDLLLLMQEEATGLPPEIAPDAHWRPNLLALFEAMVGSYLRHPWMLDIPITGSPITPNSSAWIEAGLVALARTPLTQEERIAVTLLVTGHARWYGTILAGYATQARVSGRTPEQITRFEGDLFDALIAAEEYPALRSAVDAGAFVSDSDPFRFGIERILDGVQSYLGVLAAGEAHETTAPWLVLDDEDVAGDKRVREAKKAVRQAEKALRDARRLERTAIADARTRLARYPAG